MAVAWALSSLDFLATPQTLEPPRDSDDEGIVLGWNAKNTLLHFHSCVSNHIFTPLDVFHDADFARFVYVPTCHMMHQ